MKKKTSVKDLLLYNGLTKEEYNEISPYIAKRNMQTLRMTSLFCVAFGAVFLLINAVTGSGSVFPYLFLTTGGAAVVFISMLPLQKDGLKLSVCYLMMITVFAYAFILSTSESNVAIPSTSIIVFLALFPLTIDDKPLRMSSVVVVFAFLYLVYSNFNKTPEAFRLDLINTLTFTVVGVIFYLVICNRNVHEIFESKHVEKLQKDVISSLGAVIEERDESTGLHTLRTEDYIKLITDGMKKRREKYKYSDSFYDNVLRAAPLHDIGKLKVPDSILNKPARLDKNEYESIKKHSLYGAEIIERTMKNLETDEYYRIAHNITLYHHERYDGNGYPECLSGTDIPIEARIMALADVYDALVSERVYKKAFTKEEAVSIIKEGRGTQFDPELTDIFLDSL